jgi:predicted dehydrogenase
MRVGIIGTGRMAKARSGLLDRIAGARLQWVCSREKKRAVEFIRENGLDRTEGPVRALDNWKAAVADQDTEGVIITTPNALHYQMVKTALRSGKHVLAEYPHGTSPEEGEKLIESARKKGLLLHIGLTHRYGPGHAKLKALFGPDRPGPLIEEIGSYELGKPVSYQAIICSGNPISRWYDKDDLSGGMFVASMYHFIDETVSLFGKVHRSSAEYWSRRDEEGKITSDCGNVSLAFCGGCLAQISYSRGMVPPGLGYRRRAVFEKGYFVQGNNGAEVFGPNFRGKLDLSGDNALLKETQAFFSAAAAGGPGIAENNTAAEAQVSLIVAHRLKQQALKS